MRSSTKERSINKSNLSNTTNQQYHKWKATNYILRLIVLYPLSLTHSDVRQHLETCNVRKFNAPLSHFVILMSSW